MPTGATGASGASRWGRAQERAARREYRRSLPPSYRWRRAGVTVVAVLLVGGLLTAIGHNPVSWATQRWYDLTDRTVVVQGLSLTAEPADSVAPTFRLGSLVDGEPATAWATTWPAGSVGGAPCGSTPAGVGRVVIELDPATRLRGVRVRAGLGDAGRDAQPRPARLDLTFDGGPGCVSVPLEDRPGLQTQDLDTGGTVSRVVMSVGDVYGPSATPAAPGVPRVAVSELELLARPQ